MTGPRWLAIFRCDQCMFALPTDRADGAMMCSRYRRICPLRGIPDWCKLRRAKVRRVK